MRQLEKKEGAAFDQRPHLETGKPSAEMGRISPEVSAGLLRLAGEHHGNGRHGCAVAILKVIRYASFEKPEGYEDLFRGVQQNIQHLRR